MAAELDATLEQPSEAEKRIKQLSDKVKLSETEKDELKKLSDEKDAKIATLERENEFNSGFADTVASTPQAKEFKDDIKAKVLSGYSLEDATYAVLGKAGKLNQSSRENLESPAGGSATTAVTQSGKKSIKEMTPEERRQALVEAEQKGDIAWT
jgi:hypothetical protein